MVQVVINGRVAKTRAPSMRLGSEMVYIYVDVHSMPIRVHRNIILRSSEFFRNALNGDFKENTGIVQLQGQRKELVEVYVEWLYYDTINAIEIDTEVELNRFTQLCDLYVMADMLQDQDFANAVMNTLLKETDAMETWPTGLAASAWSELPESSLMRKYIKDLWVSRSYTAWFGEQSGDVTDAPKEFWIEVAKLHTMVRERKDKVLKPSWANRCKYQFHKDGNKCS